MAEAHGDHRITHLGLCVTDLDRSLAFYRDALGLTEVGRLRVDGDPTATLLDVEDLDLELVYLERDGLRLELLHYHRPEVVGPSGPRPMNRSGFTHLSLRVGDLDALVARIIDQGGSVLEDRTVTFAGGNRGVMALDPDGVRVELIEGVAS